MLQLNALNDLQNQDQDQDQDQMFSLAKQGRRELEDMFARDAAGLPADADGSDGEH